MDKVSQYRKCVQTLLSQYAQTDMVDDGVDVQLIFDTERDHYQWMNVGWQQLHRVYRCIGHLEKYRFFWEWQRDLKGSSLLKAAKWQLIEVPYRSF